jgi:UPF0716 family protein affecting phage T7 exclusion
LQVEQLFRQQQARGASSSAGSLAVSCLAVAAVLFFAAWLLMPGVGVTDTATIFALGVS